MTTEMERICDDVYCETARFYASMYPRMGTAAAGYEILYGPALGVPEILFLGFQPGGSSSDAASEHETDKRLTIPSECRYAHAEWRLAKRMRDIWSVATLRRCTGLNAIFFRAHSVALWKQLPASIRQDIECFSFERAERLVRCIAPKQVITIGLATFRRFSAGQHRVLLPGAHGPLVVQGSVWGLPALGIVHLSGARISRTDMTAIRAFFADNADTNKSAAFR